MASIHRVTPDFMRQLEGYSLATAEILYRIPDHPLLLQTYIWQDYDRAPDFPVLHRFLAFWGKIWMVGSMRSKWRMNVLLGCGRSPLPAVWSIFTETALCFLWSLCGDNDMVPPIASVSVVS